MHRQTYKRTITSTETVRCAEQLIFDRPIAPVASLAPEGRRTVVQILFKMNTVQRPATICVHLRIDCYFRAHMEYKRPDRCLKIRWSTLALLGKFSNLRLGVYTLYAHENSKQSLYLHFLHHCYKLKPIFDNLRGLYGVSYKGTTRLTSTLNHIHVQYAQWAQCALFSKCVLQIRHK